MGFKISQKTSNIKTDLIHCDAYLLALSAQKKNKKTKKQKKKILKVINIKEEIVSSSYEKWTAFPSLIFSLEKKKLNLPGVITK